MALGEKYVDCGFEVIVGTYEEFVLGYRLTKETNSDVYNLEQSFTNHSHCESIRCVSSSGKYLASGSADESIHLYNLQSRKEHGCLVHHNGTITSLDFFENSYLFSGSEDGNIAVWHTGNWQCEKVFNAHKGGVTDLSVHPSGKLALSTGKDRSLRTWNLIKGRAAYTTNIKRVAEFVQWSPDGHLYAVGIGTRMDVYSVQVAGVIYSFDLGYKVCCVAFLSDEVLAVGGENDHIEIYHVGKKQCIMKFKAHEKRVRALKSVAVGDSEEFWLVSASNDGWIKLWIAKDKGTVVSTTPACSINSTCRITCMTVWKNPLEEDLEISNKTKKDAKSEVDMPKEKKRKCESEEPVQDVKTKKHNLMTKLKKKNADDDYQSKEKEMDRTTDTPKEKRRKHESDEPVQDAKAKEHKVLPKLKKKSLSLV